MPTKSPVESEVAAGLQQLLKRGLPVTLASADTALLNLRGIVARAIDPADEASRTAALDGTLRGLLARFPDARYAAAARALFGLPPAGPGQNLTHRRELAAAAAGHEVHHFRKRVEPRLIEKIAWELLTDADRFTRLPMIATRLAPATSRQSVPADAFAWEVAEHEEPVGHLRGPRRHRLGTRSGDPPVHELIVQGYYDAGYEPVFVEPDSAGARLDFICSNLRLPKPSRGA